MRYRITLVRDPAGSGDIRLLDSVKPDTPGVQIHRLTVRIMGIVDCCSVLNVAHTPMEIGQWEDLAYVPEAIRNVSRELLERATNEYFQLMRRESNTAADFLRRVKKY